MTRGSVISGTGALPTARRSSRVPAADPPRQMKPGDEDSSAVVTATATRFPPRTTDGTPIDRAYVRELTPPSMPGRSSRQASRPGTRSVVLELVEGPAGWFSVETWVDDERPELRLLPGGRED